MRVVFLLPCADLAGGIRVAAIYARKLKERGHDVQVVSVPAKQMSLRQKGLSWIRGNGWPEPTVLEGSHLDGTGVPHKVLECWRPIVDRDVPDADVVIATWWETIEWMTALRASKGTKVSFIQGYDPYFYLDGREELFARLATWRAPAHKIAISRWLVELAREKFGDGAVSHVPNSVDTQQFYAGPRHLGRAPTVGLLYSTPRCKGVDVALKAFDLAARQVPGLQMIAFGREMPGAGALALPPDARFVFRPAQDEIRKIYAACDVWLCGSRCEGFHLPPLEAMACGCPVVSAKVGGPMDIIEDGVNGYIAEVEDAPALARRLAEVVRLPAESWEAMSNAALRTARRYTWDDAAERFEAALVQAVGRTGAATVPLEVGEIVRKLRITFVLPFASLAGGIKVVAIYAERLRRRGHEVTVISIPQRASSRFSRLMRLKEDSADVNARATCPYFAARDFRTA